MDLTEAAEYKDHIAVVRQRTLAAVAMMRWNRYEERFEPVCFMTPYIAYDDAVRQAREEAVKVELEFREM